MTVITGLSGSGKSFLAFDTIFSLKDKEIFTITVSFARQFLSQMSKCLLLIFSYRSFLLSTFNSTKKVNLKTKSIHAPYGDNNEKIYDRHNKKGF